MNIKQMAEMADPAGMDGRLYYIAEVTPATLEHFADMVLEEAAIECDKRAHAGDAGALMAARAIRALKGAKK